jgi:hypothetical protein
MELSKQETLALPTNAPALMLLEDYQATEGYNWRNWMHESHQYGTGSRSRDQRYTGRGLGVADRHGLVPPLARAFSLAAPEHMAGGRQG